MTIIPQDSFQEYLVNSIVKFFRENTTVDFNGKYFNDTYKALFDNNNDKIRDSLKEFDGILVPEFVEDQVMVKYNNGNYVGEEKTATVKTSVKARTFITSMNLRVLCDIKEKLGDVKLKNFIGIISKILEDQEIVIYDFKNSVATDLKLKWKNQETRYVNLNAPYKEYQQAVFTLDVWCDVFTEEENDILLTHVIDTDPQ